MTATADGTLVLRADAGHRMGTGHVMRCLGLAQAWRRRSEAAAARGLAGPPAPPAILVTTASPSPLDKRVAGAGVQIVRLEAKAGSREDAIQTACLARDAGTAWLVVDGYQFADAYQRTLKECGVRFLLLDDVGHARRYCADIVLNPNLHAREELYRLRDASTRLLLGTRYALLRAEFSAWRRWRRRVPEAAVRLLVTLGGSDPDNVSLEVVRALGRSAVDGLVVVVVAGPENVHGARLAAALTEARFPARLETNATDMPRLLAWAELAVSGGGSTCWEMAFMGLPSLVLVLAENQRPIAERLASSGAALNLGRHEDVRPDQLARAVRHLSGDRSTRMRMARAGRALVDGAGSSRVVDAMVDR